MGLTRIGSVLAVTVGVLGAAVVAAAPVDAERTTGWATWGPITGSSNAYATTMQLPAQGFPLATVATDSRSNVQVPGGTTTYLGGANAAVPTDVGIKYGSSRGNAYLNLRPKADNAASPSTTTYTFDAPTPSRGWTFVLGDIDSDAVRISAKNAAGVALTPTQISAWFRSTFNYVGGTDLPTWDPATATLTGNPAGLDTDGASAWFEPEVSLSSLTFTFTRRTGFPVYQTWFASVARTISGTVTDVSTPGQSCPVTGATVRLLAPDGRLLASTRPAADGTYSFGQYATQPGYTVQVDRPDDCAVVGAAQRTVSTASEDATADFSIRQVIPQPVSGTVTTSDGTPVAGVVITLTPPPGGGPVRTTTTDEDGAYLFDNNKELDGYTVAVTSVPEGYDVSGPREIGFDILPGQPVTGKDFTLAEQPSVSGTVTGGGEGLGGATLTLTPVDGGAAITTSTLGDGTYVFDHVPAGDYDLAVTPPDGFRPEPPITDVKVGSSDIGPLDFGLTRPGAVGGQVTDVSPGSTGRPVGGAEITVTGPGGTRTLRTEASGEYFLGDLDPGEYTITLTVPDGFTASGPTTRTVTITGAGEIRGGQDFAVEAVVTTPPTSTTTSPTSTTTSPTSTTTSPTSTTTTTTSGTTTTVGPTGTATSGSSTTVVGTGPGSSGPGSGGGLAYTGFRATGLLALAAVLLVTGAGLLTLVRRPGAHPH